MSVSYWNRATPARRLEAEVAVIGGGVCGLAASIELERRGVRAQIVERGAIGSGASTRNAGYLMRGAADNYAAACRDYGRETARTLWRWSEKNLAILREWGIEGLESYKAMPSCLLALRPGERAELEASADLLREDGFEVGLIAGGEDTLWASGRPLTGLVNPRDATINPAELTGLLGAKLAHEPVEGAEVYNIEVDHSGVVIRAQGLALRTQRALVCLNGYAPQLLPELGAAVTPQRGQMLVLDAPDARLDFAYYANHGSEYIRSAGERLIAVGGCRESAGGAERTAEDAVTPGVQSAIESFAAGLLGGRYPIVARWAGTMGFSPDHMPLVGPVPDRAERVWFCGGFTGHGMSLGVRTARAAVGAMLDGEPTPFPLGRALCPGG